METISARHIKDGREFDFLFTKANGEDVTIKRNAKLSDTVEFLPKAILSTLHQTKKFAEFIKAKNPFDTCKRIWHFIYQYIRYHKDEPGKEQIRSPQRSWHDRGYNDPDTGCDCDDYTVLIVSTLCNLKIKSLLRVALFDEDNGYQHIYPVAIINGQEIPVDCVTERFNYQVPFLKKIDKAMELQFLNGIPAAYKADGNINIDAEDLLDGLDIEEIGELGKGKVKAKIQQATTKAKTAVKTIAKKVQSSAVVQKAKKAVNVVNKVNPVTALLRAGILAALKTNILNVAGKLRYSYLTTQQALQKSFDLGKHQRLIQTRQRLEKIFYTAGGDPKNFKEAILTGRGNRNKEVPLAGFTDINYNNYNNNNTLSQILGGRMFVSEMQGVSGLGSLGVVTSAAITAAMGTMTAIASALKSIGSLRKDGKQDGSEAMADESNLNISSGASENSTPEDLRKTPIADNSAETVPATPAQTTDSDGGENKSNYADTPAATKSGTSPEAKTTDSATPSGTDEGDTSVNTPAARGTTTDTGTSTNPTPTTESGFKKFIAWCKANPVPASLGGLVVVGGISYGLYRAFGSKKKEGGQALSGLPKKAKKKKASHSSYKVRVHRLK